MSLDLRSIPPAIAAELEKIGAENRTYGFGSKAGPEGELWQETEALDVTESAAVAAHEIEEARRAIARYRRTSSPHMARYAAQQIDRAAFFHALYMRLAQEPKMPW